MDNGGSKTLNGWREIKVRYAGRKIGEEKKVKEKQLYIVVESFQVQKYYSKAVFSSLITFPVFSV